MIVSIYNPEAFPACVFQLCDTFTCVGRLICPEGRVSSLNKSNPIQYCMCITSEGNRVRNRGRIYISDIIIVKMNWCCNYFLTCWVSTKYINPASSDSFTMRCKYRSERNTATLTHWGRDEIDAFCWQMISSNVFPWIKMLQFRLKWPLRTIGQEIGGGYILVTSLLIRWIGVAITSWHVEYQLNISIQLPQIASLCAVNTDPKKIQRH